MKIDGRFRRRTRWPMARPRAAQRSPAVERAVRAAEIREPRLPPGFASWVLGRVVAMLLLVGVAALVYDCASSDRFEVRSVRIQGNVLLSSGEIESVAAVRGINIFWLNRAQVAARLNGLPLVQRVEVSATLPDTLDIKVIERQPVGFWTSGDQSFLVDSEGVILKAVDESTAQARVCAGQPCDPRLATLPSVSDTEREPLIAGSRVDANALTSTSRLESLLPGVGIQPVGFEWSRQAGLEVSTREGWRARFDQAADLDRQVSALRAVRDQLTRTRTTAELIDVRFGDRPYFR